MVIQKLFDRPRSYGNNIIKLLKVQILQCLLSWWERYRYQKVRNYSRRILILLKAGHYGRFRWKRDSYHCPKHGFVDWPVFEILKIRIDPVHQLSPKPEDEPICSCLPRSCIQIILRGIGLLVLPASKKNIYLQHTRRTGLATITTHPMTT